MRKIEVLDCTLRDGGYVNDWNFGFSNIKTIINELALAKIEYIECGFIKDNKKNHDLNRTIYYNINELEKIIPANENSRFLVMMQVKDYDIDKLPPKLNGKIGGIRLSFHKSEIDKAIDYAINIKEKGYKLFFQPTAINSYTKEEIEKLLKTCNEVIKPDVVAIVDTLGVLNSSDVRNITYLFDEKLNNNIDLALHCHNNLLLAYTNAITFISSTKEDRNIIIDSSLGGMGRGAGNFPTEIALTYLNENYNKNYNYKIVLQLFDKCVIDISKKYMWGYSSSYMLNAKHKIHPNYEKFLRDNMKKMNLELLDNLLRIIPENKKDEFDIKLAEKIVNECEIRLDDTESYNKLKKYILNKKIIIVNNQKMKKYDEDKFVISINIENTKNINALIVRNKEEFEKIKNIISKNVTIIALFSKSLDEDMLCFKYIKLLSNQFLTRTDNLLVMLLQILAGCSFGGSIVFEEMKMKHIPFKYKISKLFNQNSQMRNELVVQEYVNYFKQNYNMNIIKERLECNENSCSYTNKIEQ